MSFLKDRRQGQSKDPKVGFFSGFLNVTPVFDEILCLSLLLLLLFLLICGMGNRLFLYTNTEVRLPKYFTEYEYS